MAVSTADQANGVRHASIPTPPIEIGDHVRVAGYDLFGKVDKLFDGAPCREHGGHPAVAVVDCGGWYRRYAVLVSDLVRK